MAAKKKARRTTHRSSKGTKLYAKRDAKGRFKDIQTYKRAHAADLRHRAKDEEASQPAARVRKAAKQLERTAASTLQKVESAVLAAVGRPSKKKSPKKKKTSKKKASKKK